MAHRRQDEIDGIVDEMVGDADRAARLKEALHQKLDGLQEPGKRFAPQSDVDESEDDLWDNMPV